MSLQSLKISIRFQHLYLKKMDFFFFKERAKNPSYVKVVCRDEHEMQLLQSMFVWMVLGRGSINLCTVCLYQGAKNPSYGKYVYRNELKIHLM